MTLNEWKAKLTPAGVLVICYLMAPFFVQLFMGANDVIYGALTFSIAVQTGLGIAVVYKLFTLKEQLNAHLAAWLKKFAQPLEKTRELAEKASHAAGFVLIVAIVWPPVGEIIAGGRLMTLLKISALGYAAYLGYELWKLAEPFMAAAKAAPPSADPEEEPAPVRTRRCTKCGQQMGDLDSFCSFCKHTAD
ncbi:MAG: hypothetical protein Q8O90_09195 [Elusimicrobiota bacterium]|nr:hypothetical protein [Elusimicrobiota bacterium]